MKTYTEEDFNLPGVIAYTVLDEQGEVSLASGGESEMLETVAPYVQHMANLIGEPFGFDDVEEIQVLGKNTTAICVPGEDGVLGLLCESRAKIGSIVKKLTY